MNRNKAVRTFIFNQLNGNITYEANIVPVHDAVLQEDYNGVYVILMDERADINLNNCMNSWDCEIDIDVYSKQMQMISRDVIDDVAEQVEDKLNDALALGTEYEGWQFINFYMASSRSNSYELSPTKSQINISMTFRLQANRL